MEPWQAAMLLHGAAHGAALTAAKLALLLQERIAHELHDHLGAYLAGIAFRFKLLAETLERRAIPEAAQAHADAAHALKAAFSV